MQETNFPVWLNVKIPWVTKGFYYLLNLCLLLLIVFGIYMLPPEHSPGEMKAAYFILTTPETAKKVFVFAALGTPLFYLLYKYSRVRRQALLTLLPDTIEVDNYKTVLSYSITEITNISCNDALDPDGFPKGKLTVDLKDRSGHFISMTLMDYCHSDQVMSTLLNYKNIKFDLTNFRSNPEILDIR